MNLNLQLSLLCFSTFFNCIHSQPPFHYGYPSFSRHDPFVYHRSPYLGRAAVPHLSRVSPQVMPIRAIRRNSFQSAPPKPKPYWNPVAPFPYRYYHPRHQSLVAAPSRSPVKVIYAPMPVPPPQIVFSMPSPQLRAPKSVVLPKVSSSSVDMLSSGSDASNVRYIPVVKKVTHHHIHHIVASPESRLHLGDQQNVAQLSSLLKSLINTQKTSSIDAFNLLADGSSQIPIKTHSTESDLKPLEVENEEESTKNINHEIVFEDEEEDAYTENRKQFVQMIDTKKPKGTDNRKKWSKTKLVYKMNPKIDATKGNRVITVHDLVKASSEKSETGKGPYYSLFLGVPDASKSTKTVEELDENSSESDQVETDNQEYLIANRRADGEVEKSSFKDKKGKTFEKLKVFSEFK